MRILIFIFCMLFMLPSYIARAAEMVNVEYVHMAIQHQWNIDVPYNPLLENKKVAANMKYLLTAIDRANAILNGGPVTDYGNSEYATLYAADTVATNEAVARLIKKNAFDSFIITTTDDTDSFSFKISAKGTFIIDWGEGEPEYIIRDNTNAKSYKHSYTTGRKIRSITIRGKATEYSKSTSTSAAAISFSYNNNIAKIEGSLGAIFGTIGDGSVNGQQPRFYNTFYNCSNLEGEIPKNIFAGIYGPPTAYMFSGTFGNCGKLTKIPEDVFGNIAGELQYAVFKQTFSGCFGLGGPSAKIGGKYLYEIWPDAAVSYVNGCYTNAKGLDDYDNIPDAWK